jgi:hypothetical protein
LDWLWASSTSIKKKRKNKTIFDFIWIIL